LDISATKNKKGIDFDLLEKIPESVHLFFSSKLYQFPGNRPLSSFRQSPEISCKEKAAPDK
jgi:hypothetical protein